MPAKFPRPFFRTNRGWYVQLGKSQVKLADGPENPATEKAAWDRYHVVMAGRQNPTPAATLPSSAIPGSCGVAEVFDAFLDWCQKHRAGRTYDFYAEYLQDFLTRTKTGRLPAASLKPFHVIAWADEHLTVWSPTTRRGAIVAVQRAFNWAVKVGHLAASPVPFIEKPRPERRKQAVTPGDWERIKGSYKPGDPFRDLLEFCWETGCRAQEAKAVESRHVDLAKHRVVFPAAEAKGKRRQRVIYLSGRAAEIVAERMKESSGVLFRNEDGRPWTAYATSCRFARLEKKLGVRFCATAFRHGFATRKLVEKHDHLTVAELLGHVNGQMLGEVYAHLGDNPEHLRRALDPG